MEIWTREQVYSSDNAAALKVFVDAKILHESKRCPSCALEGVHKLLHVNSNKQRTNGRVWACSTCNYECSLYDGTFFSGSRLEARTWLQILYCFAVDEQRQSNLKHELEISDHTVVACKRRCRQFCVKYFQAYPIKVGGSGHKVEVDECVLSKPKYNRGRPIDERWVVGGVDTATKEQFMEMVECRDSRSITAVIAKYILPHSIVVTDCWRGYSDADLQALQIAHMTVNHSQNFVDPITQATTNHAESGWQKLRLCSAAKYGFRGDSVQEHIAEYLWRRKFGAKNVAMGNLLSQLGTICGAGQN